jgi:transcriptional regulator with XRE-family HTH domain
MNSFGAKLKRARIQAGLTQEQLAEKMEVSVISVQNWESGKTKVRVEKLEKLSYFYNIQLHDLISEMIMSSSKSRVDNFPYFLFDEDTNNIIRTLHLNLAQQELFGLLYIYHAEYLDKTEMDSETLREDLKRIPYEFISKSGSIQLLNIAEGLYHVLQYVQTDFLMRVLRLAPEKEFDICTLPKELICDFIDSGYKQLDETDMEADYNSQLYFHYNMYKARRILPFLENVPVHLTDGWWSNPLREDVPEWVLHINDDNIPEYLICRRNEVPAWYDAGEEKFREEWNRYHNTSSIRYGIQTFTEYSENEKGEWILSINDTGRKLLTWFRENES